MNLKKRHRRIKVSWKESLCKNLTAPVHSSMVCVRRAIQAWVVRSINSE
jgi:hypothetical protein